MNTFLIFVIIISVFIYLNFPISTFTYSKPKLYNNLITQQEAEYILNYTKDKFTTSKILSGLDKTIRKSETTWINKDDDVVNKIYDRLSKIFKFDKRNAEQLQVVKYTPGGYYKEHHDACCEQTEHCNDFTKNSGQRVLTILIYLNDDFEEGGTNFPTLHLNLKPQKYGGVVFYPLANNKTCHPDSLHSGIAVKSGVKYVCNIWIRELPVA
jgi:prolyl 4-hydroxylase